MSIRPKLVFIIISWFSTGIITCTAQGASQYFVPTAPGSSYATSLALLKSSFILQLSLNAGFFCVVTVLQYRKHQKQTDGNTTKICAILSTLMVFIVICNIFRTVQIFVAPSSTLWTEEVYFWVFEATMMLVYTASFHIIHPARFLLATCESE